MKKFLSGLQIHSNRKRRVWLYTLLFALIGSAVIFSTHAALRGTAVESENGTLVGQANKIKDSSASSKNALAFGAFIKQSGNQLTLGGQPYRFVGYNAYQLTTLWAVNHGCGAQLSDAELDSFFASLRPNSMVRTWAYQMNATNEKTQLRDFSPIDRVVNTASKHGVRLILAIGNQAGDCDDGHWHDKAWYDGGYKTKFNDNGFGDNTVPYFNWVQEIANRYKNSPTVGMWELVNEPEVTNCAVGFKGNACYGHTTCPAGAATSLKAFFDTVGGLVKQIDPNHLISSGVVGSGQCGAGGSEYKLVHSSPAINVGSFHDYGSDTVGLPGDQFNGLALRITQMNELAKPLITGEMGIKGSAAVTPCTTLATRSNQIKAKFDAQLNAGIRGVLLWNWQLQTDGCNYAIVTPDPIQNMILNYPL